MRIMLHISMNWSATALRMDSQCRPVPWSAFPSNEKLSVFPDFEIRMVKFLKIAHKPCWPWKNTGMPAHVALHQVRGESCFLSPPLQSVWCWWRLICTSHMTTCPSARQCQTWLWLRNTGFQAWRLQRGTKMSQCEAAECRRLIHLHIFFISQSFTKSAPSLIKIWTKAGVLKARIWVGFGRHFVPLKFSRSPKQIRPPQFLRCRAFSTLTRKVCSLIGYHVLCKP